MRTVSVARQRLPGEREVYVEARFGGLEVTLGDEHGDILSADMTGIHNVSFFSAFFVKVWNKKIGWLCTCHNDVIV